MPDNKVNKYVCVHGHFYQPPRENAWLEKIELQDSAHPFHDWNERVAYESYTPNTASRMLDSGGIIKDIVNNYSKISFNFGPTLLSWMKSHTPETYREILKADEESVRNFSGHGNAIAQSYNHLIMPLANARDIETQVIWGICDFKKRFKRDPEGMWLSETAVNTDVLESLAVHNIKFTILAPRQAAKIRKSGSSDWEDVQGEKIDPRRAYQCNLPSGKTITLFFYDGQVAKDVAFNKLLDNGKNFSNRLLSALGTKNSNEPLLSHIATDGESYGHHHAHGDMALAYMAHDIETGKEATLTNYGAFLASNPPSYEVQINENSSWSCVHGVERWRSDCGCHTGGGAGWNQKWRAPLKEALDWLRDKMIEVFEREGEELFHNPWDARNAYIEVVMRRKKSSINKFLAKYGKELGDNGKRSKALRLLEMQRHSMLMYTSCGWFFNDVSGIETIQILQYACRALQLAEQIAEGNLEEGFIQLLKKAKSNVPENGTAADIYRKHVVTVRLDLMRVGMHYAVASLFEAETGSFPIFNYSAKREFFDRREAGIHRIAFGRIKIKSKTTYSEKHFSFAAIYMGQHNLTGYISVDMQQEDYDKAYNETLRAFRNSNLSEMLSILPNYFGKSKFSIWQLFNDEKRKVLEFIMNKYLGKLDMDLRDIYEQEYQLINALTNANIPIPEIYLHTFRYVFNSELKNCLENEIIDINQLQTIAFKFKKWNLSLRKRIPYDQIVSSMINRNLEALSNGNNGIDRLNLLNRALNILKDFGLKLNLYQSQNMYFRIGSNNNSGNRSKKWKEVYSNLGKYLGVKIEL